MLDRAAEALVEIHFGDVAQMLPRFGDRCERVAYVPGAGGAVLRLQVDAQNVRDASPQLANAGRRAAPDVEDVAGGLLRGCVTREQIRVQNSGTTAPCCESRF